MMNDGNEYDESDCSPSRTTHWVLSERNDWIHVITPFVNTQSTEFQQEPLMIYFVKHLAKVHDYDISLVALVESIV